MIFEDGDFHFRRTDYELEEVLKKIEKAGLPDRVKRILQDGEVVE